jgi:predicted DNA-binding transcriptional regulator AlpA
VADQLLNVEQAADVLGVGVQTMYRRRHLGQPPAAWRRGRRLVYRRSELDRFLASEREATLR